MKPAKIDILLLIQKPRYISRIIDFCLNGICAANKYPGIRKKRSAPILLIIF